MQNHKSVTQTLLRNSIFFLIAIVLLTACNNSPKPAAQEEAIKVPLGTSVAVVANVKDDWAGQHSTEANDSVLYSSNSSYKAYTNASGQASIKDSNYHAPNPIVMEACGNNEISGKVFSRALYNMGSDTSLQDATFTIGPLGGTGDTIPVNILVTDTNGNPRVGYTVQIKLGRTNFGPAATTGSNGWAVYCKGLQQGYSYTAQAFNSGSVSPEVVVSTSPLTGSSGNFCSINVYIRY
jgi:hypothetical protein